MTVSQFIYGKIGFILLYKYILYFIRVSGTTQIFHLLSQENVHVPTMSEEDDTHINAFVQRWDEIYGEMMLSLLLDRHDMFCGKTWEMFK